MSSESQTHKTSIASDEIDLGKLFGVLLDAKWLIVGITAIFTVIGIAYALLATPIYKADSLVQVEQKSSGISSILGGDMGDVFSQESPAATEIEIINSRMVLGATVDNLNLTIVATPYYFPIIGKGLARMLDTQSNIKVERFSVPQDLDEPASTITLTDNEEGLFTLTDADDNVVLQGKVGQLVEKNGYRILISKLEGEPDAQFSIQKITKLDAILNLKKSLSVAESGKSSGMIALSIEGEDKAKIKRILNDIDNNYLMQNVQRSSAEAQNSLKFIQKNMPQIKAKLDKAETLLNNYRQKNQSVNLDLETKSKLDVMVSLESKLGELSFKESDISQKFTKDHPTYRSLLEQRQQLLKEKKDLEKQLENLPSTQREILRLMRDVKVNQAIYVQLLNKSQELNIIKASAVGNVRIIDGAVAHTKPVKPKKALIMVLATLLGGMFSVAFVLIKMAFHHGLENPDEIEEIGLPVYATIPKSEKEAAKTLRHHQHKHTQRSKTSSHHAFLLAVDDPTDVSIEALRGLRTSLHFAMMEAKNNVLMFTGPSPCIGKSFVANNFAAVNAQLGQQVLLIDADMRKGYLGKTLGLKDSNGLSDILSGKSEIVDMIKKTKIEGMDIISRGDIPPNPSELLMHHNFKLLLNYASIHYDLVIVDTPPILAVTDAAIVGRLAGAVMMVGAFGKTDLKEVEVARARLEQSNIEVKGFILNMIEKRASSGYGYGYGYYNYEYKSKDKA